MGGVDHDRHRVVGVGGCGWFVSAVDHAQARPDKTRIKVAGQIACGLQLIHRRLQGVDHGAGGGGGFEVASIEHHRHFGLVSRQADDAAGGSFAGGVVGCDGFYARVVVCHVAARGSAEHLVARCLCQCQTHISFNALVAQQTSGDQRTQQQNNEQFQQGEAC